ncbi:MAG: dienelactone hydrolase family protein [Bdellovibrionales bacterium]|nr:dienelactone hydrolase family protein [Bdellovibrionales bacterium]
MRDVVPDQEIRTLDVVLEDRFSGVRLPGSLRIPPAPTGWVIFAHGSGSSRFSPRNIQVAKALNQRHQATLLFDLLTNVESGDRKNIFNIPLLAQRLHFSIQWLQKQLEYNGTPIALFGASTGAAAALSAATVSGKIIRAVVSRGGRVDLAKHNAKEVECPVLLIVGGWDEPVLSWNREVLPLLKHGRLKVIPGATHLFEEPHALPAVIDSAAAFLEEEFRKSLPHRPTPGPFP